MTSDEIYRAQAAQILSAFQGTHDLDSLLSSLITVLDSFDRLLSGSQSGSTPNLDVAAVLRTCGRIAEQLESAVAAAGLVSFGERGDELDLHRYQVIDVAPPEGLPENTIVEVVRRGYQRGGRVFRPADVIVTGQQEETAP